MRTRITPNMDYFYAVIAILKNSGNIEPWKNDDGIWLDRSGMQTIEMEIYFFYKQRYQALW